MMNSIVIKCRKILEDHYRERFAGLILYGSMARGESDSDSDIDLLVLLKGSFDHLLELRKIIDLLDPVQLESDYFISAKPAALDEYETGSINLYRNAKRDGASV